LLIPGRSCLEATDRLNEFREIWKGAYDHNTKILKPKSLIGKQKYQESLKIFFRLTHDMEWITKNPAAKLTRTLRRWFIHSPE
jgi:hypothetical protein